MKPEPLRCCAPHPDPRMWARGWNCNHKLTDIIPGTVIVQPGEELRPGCSTHRCSKCGATYTVCPIDRVA